MAEVNGAQRQRMRSLHVISNIKVSAMQDELPASRTNTTDNIDSNNFSHTDIKNLNTF